MHRALGIPEIRDSILAHLAASKKDLTAVCLTSRALFLSAVRLRWRSLDELDVYKLLLATIGPSASWNTTKHYWARVIFYSDQVHELSLDIYGRPKRFARTQQQKSVQKAFDDDSAALVTLLSTGAKRLFPKLRILHFCAPHIQHYHLVPDLLNSGTESLSIKVRSYGKPTAEAITTLLDDIPSLVPNLTAINLDFQNVLPYSTAVLCKILPRLPKLISFSSTVPCGDQVLRDIAHHRTMKTVKLELSQPARDAWIWLEEFHTSLSSLQELSLNLGVRRLQGLSVFVGALPRSLVNLNLHYHLIDDDFVPFNSDLAKTISGSMPFLRQLSLHVLGIHDVGEAPPWDAFSSVLECRHMESFTLHIEAWRDFDWGWKDSHLFSMAVAWPALQRLHLDWKYVVGYGYMMAINAATFTLLGLSSILLKCPSVERIILTSIDASIIPTQLPGNRQSHSSVEIWVGGTRIGAVSDVIAFLKPLCPGVHLDCWGRANHDHGMTDQEESRWQEVCRILNVEESR